MKTTVALLLLGFGITSAQAQQAIAATGGNASGSGGTVAYSVGQVCYTIHTSSNGSVAQSVQQPYEISITLGAEDPKNMQVYPNPTTNYLTLNVDNFQLSTLSFQLYDITGKLIENKKITTTIETIRLENLPSATYILKVNNNKKTVKIFKIIKH